MNLITFLQHRSRHHWLLLLTLVFGVVLATTLLASGPILVDALMEFGLRRTLLNASLREDIFYLTQRGSAGQEQYQVTNDQLLPFLNDRLDDQVTSLIPAGHVGFLYPWNEGKIAIDRRLTLGFYGSDFDELSQHARLIEGNFPEDDSSNPDEIQVYVGKFLADALAIQVGDVLPVSISVRAGQPELFLRIAGIILPQDFQDPYWLDHFNPFWPLNEAGDNILFGVFIPQDSFFSRAKDIYPSLDVSYFWQVNMRLDQVTFKNIGNVQTIFGSLGNDLLVVDPKLRVETSMLEILNEYSIEANIVRAPLYFLVGIVVLVALYYLVMMASLYLGQIRSEFAILHSRGASGADLFKLELVEGIFISAIALVCGPIFAWLVVRWLAISGPLAVLTEPAWGLSLPPIAWLFAGIAAVASLCSLLLPLPRALRQSITSYQQNLVRAGRPPLWQRFYLDVFALTIGIILLYRIELYGSIIGGSSENPQVDLMLILAPLCLLMGAGAIFLRIFPALLRSSARIADQQRGLPLILALQHAARDPKHVTRLVLLLMLAMALGLFSASLDATLTKNELDRANYYVGSDLRVLEEPVIVETINPSGVQMDSWVWRSDAALITTGFSPGLDLLAVHPDTFSSVSRYRRDFASQPVGDLLEKLNADWEENWIPLPVTALPGEPAQIKLWFSLPFSMQVEPDRFDWIEPTTFEVRLRPAQGEDIRVLLHPTGPPDDPDARWYEFQGNVPVLDSESYPLSLISLWLNSSAIKLREYEAVWLDDISVLDRLTEEEVVVESFEYANQFVWKSMTYPMSVYSMESHPHNGDASLSMYFDTVGMSPLRWYGIHRIDDLALQPIPALASEKFLARTESTPGDTIRIKVKVPGAHEWDSITFKILDVINYFPTMYETKEAGYLVTLHDPLFEQINLYRYHPLQSNELLISSVDPGLTRTNLLESGLLLNQAISVDSILLDLKTNPLAIGLRSAALFGYYLTTALCLVGFGTHFYLSTRQRVANYSILRALGMSPSQLYITLFVEQTVLMLSGLTLGTILGVLLNQLTLSGLPLRLGELDTIPPFIVQTDWFLVLRVYITLVAAFLLSLGIAIFFLWRVKIHRVLRIGEE